MIGERLLIPTAMKWIAERHGEQQDRAGQPFVGHPLRVAAYTAWAGGSPSATVAALLHDLVEDTPTSLDEIEETFGSYVREIVDALTRREGEKYFDYIERVAIEPTAIVVKRADLWDNMDGRRALLLDAGWFEGMYRDRYEPAMKRLGGAL